MDAYLRDILPPQKRDYTNPDDAVEAAAICPPAFEMKQYQDGFMGELACRILEVQGTLKDVDLVEQRVEDQSGPRG